MSSSPADLAANRSPAAVAAGFDTGESEAFYGAATGAVIGLLVGLFTVAGLIPAIFSFALYGLIISGPVSLLRTFSRSRG